MRLASSTAVAFSTLTTFFVSSQRSLVPSFTEFLEGFVESGFLALCALIAQLTYLVPLDAQKCLPRAPTPLLVR